MRLFFTLCQRLLLVVVVCWIPSFSLAQTAPVQPGTMNAAKDTLSVTLPQLEQLFVQQNLQLIARKLNIEASRAQILQAKLWDNPTLTAEVPIHNSINDKYFDAASKDGELISQIDQIIRTAGKHSKLARLNQITTDIAEYTFYDVVRSLKLQLRTDFYQLIQYRQTALVLDSGAQSLTFLVKALNDQVTKGNVALKEALRLQALQLSVQSDLNDARNQAFKVEDDLRYLLRLKPTVAILALADTALDAPVKLPSLDSLITVALASRQDLKVATANVDYAQQNLKYQKALAVPDVDIHANYTRKSNFITPYFGLGAAVGLPLLNRNQGNIQTAKINIQAQKALLEDAQNNAMNDVTAYYKQLLSISATYEAFDSPFAVRFDAFFRTLRREYERRAISLLEFIDFFDSYRDTKVRALSLEQQLRVGKQSLNYSVGVDILK